MGGKRPNRWGLYDMHGNAAEWVLDQYDEAYYAKDSNTADPLNIPQTLFPRVVRGGGWDDDPILFQGSGNSDPFAAAGNSG